MEPSWDAAKNVLCVRLDSLGDILMTSPAIRALKNAVPRRRVTLLTSPSGARAARHVPEIDDVVVYDAPWMKATVVRPNGAADRQMIEHVRGHGFDGAVVFTVYSQSPLPAALFCHLADIPLRLAHARENPYQLLTHWIKEPEPDRFIRHEAERQLDLVASIGCRTGHTRLSFHIAPEVRPRIRQMLGSLGTASEKPLILIHPGATAASRRYPAEHFADAARLLSREGLDVVFTGGPDEVDLVESIRSAAGVPSVSVAGRLSLEELGALIAEADLLISNNSGPVHIAAAVNTPVVDLYALTNPQHTPWQVPHRVLFHRVPCGYCYKSVCPEGHGNCLAKVEPAAVVRAALELLNEGHQALEGLQISRQF